MSFSLQCSQKIKILTFQAKNLKKSKLEKFDKNPVKTLSFEQNLLKNLEEHEIKKQFQMSSSKTLISHKKYIIQIKTFVIIHYFI